MIPNYAAVYAIKYDSELSETELDPRYLELLAWQVRELAEITARHTQERVLMRLAIQDEGENEENTE